MRQQNHFKIGGAVLALGICAAFYQPTVARSQGEDGANTPPAPNPTMHKFGGPTGQVFDGIKADQMFNVRNNRVEQQNDQINNGQMPLMRLEEIMVRQLDLTPAQQDAVQDIYEREREQMRLIQEQTRTYLGMILTAEQKAKLAQTSMQGPPENGPQNGQNNSRPANNNRPMMPGAMQDEDHGRPVELIARDLGVTPEQFREAFKKVRPAARGERPTEEQLHSNHKILAEALGVSIEKLDAVMDKYRPEGPDVRPHREQ